MNESKKKILIASIIGVIVLALGIAYAISMYGGISAENEELVVGDIYMHYNETNALTMQDILPSNDYDPTKYFEFTIDGKNTTTNKDIVYDIQLIRGSVPNGKLEANRILDRFIRFRLVSVSNNVETEIFTDMTYNNLASAKRIHVEKILKNTTSEITHRYRLYMWVGNDVLIGGEGDSNIDYTESEWSNAFASIKVNVTGDFENKEIQPEPCLVMKNLNSIQEWQNIRTSITSIEFHTDGVAPSNPVATINVTDDTSIGNVTLYTVDDGLNNNTYKAIVVANDVIYAPSDAANMFGEMSNLVNFNSRNFKVDNTTILTGMFYNCTNLMNVSGLANWNVSKVENISSMFFKCLNLETIDLSNWKTNSLMNMTQVFAMRSTMTDVTSPKLSRIILSNKFDTSKVLGMGRLFFGVSQLEDYSFLEYFDTSSATNFTEMFLYNQGLENLDYLANWNVANVTNMTRMFASCSNLTDASAINDWNINASANFTSMFTGASTHPEFTQVAGTWSDGTFTPSN